MLINNEYPIAFNANAYQYMSAVSYLKSTKRKAILSSFKDSTHNTRIILKQCVKKIVKNTSDTNNKVFSEISEILKQQIKNIIKNFKFSNTRTSRDINSKGILFFNPDKIEGIQYGIDVFKNLTMREIIFLLYRFRNMAVKRGCNNGCEHCFLDAKRSVNTLNHMPYEDFEKITDGFNKLNKRINDILKNKNWQSLVGNTSREFNYSGAGEYVSEPTAFSFDSDGMNITLADKTMKEYDYIDLVEKFYTATGKSTIFDTVGWNPNNKILQARAEKYAKYFSDAQNSKKVQQVNLSVNTFGPLYTRSHALGYRSNANNDMRSPKIQKGKLLYDLYIDKVANMLLTFRDSKNLHLILTYSSNSDKGMDGHYYNDLLIILKDVQKKCAETLKNKYKDTDYAAEIRKITDLIDRSIYLAHECKYQGRYKYMYNSLNPNSKRGDSRYTQNIPDINLLSKDDYNKFFHNNFAILDANGEIYYSQNENSLRKLGKCLRLSVNGQETPKISILETRS